MSKKKLRALREKLCADGMAAKKAYDQYHYDLKPLGTHELGRLSGAQDATLEALRAFDAVFPEVEGR